MHTTTASPEDVSVTQAAMLDGWQFTALQAPLPAPIFSVSRTPAAVDRPQPAELDLGELAPELTNARHEEYLARRTLDELLEHGALAALFC
jgi:hypothetical protein